MKVKALIKILVVITFLHSYISLFRYFVLLAIATFSFQSYGRNCKMLQYMLLRRMQVALVTEDR